ncbi:hypothetical protein GU926_18065 [Nibribacter ruber]|uniref:tRNA (Guanine-N1)-methyltransferase n=1 Tax=Nibribacter ruber TaxID=2698458 RepID=A0A6P1P4B9_9BACT|nr:hypothetical protein [Nibribacter ruber]QHL89233.1 hypothetical protein GU926_18065 [Nibribacter ruber]
MKALALSIVFGAAVLTSGLAQAQTKTATPARNRAAYTLPQQFNSLKFRSSAYTENGQSYRVVRESGLDALLKSVQDTLQLRQQSIKNAGKDVAVALEKAKQEITDQKAQIQALQQENAKKEQQLQQGAHDVASLSVLGMDMDKQMYVWLSLGIILGLGILSAVLSVMYKKSNVEAQEKIDAYEEVSEEFKNYKQAAREKEIKLKRDQQSEANKVEELKQQLAQLRN